MSQYEMNSATAATADQSARWPHQQLQHLAVHTPIQVPRGGDTTQLMTAYANGQLGLSVPNAASPYAPQTFNQQTTLINGSRQPGYNGNGQLDQQKMALMAAAQQQRDRLQQGLVQPNFGQGMQQGYLDGLDINPQKQLLWNQQQIQAQSQVQNQVSDGWFEKPWNQNTLVQPSPQLQSAFNQVSNAQPHLNQLAFGPPPRQQQQMMDPPRNFVNGGQNGPAQLTSPIASSQPQMMPQTPIQGLQTSSPAQSAFQQTSVSQNSSFSNLNGSNSNTPAPQQNGFCSVTPAASDNASPAPSQASATPGSGFLSPRPPSTIQQTSNTPMKEELDIMGFGSNEKSQVDDMKVEVTNEENVEENIGRPRLHSILDYPEDEPMDHGEKDGEKSEGAQETPVANGNLNEDEASRLLLSFSQSMANIPEQNALASLRIEEKIRQEAAQPENQVNPLSQVTSSPQENGSISTPTSDPINTVPTTPTNLNQAQESVTSSPSTSNPPTASHTTSNRGFFRAPGLGPLEMSDSLKSSIDKKEVFTCPVCGFSCGSKFHFQSHMNTHGDHRCSICNYTCRTEGRLKKHFREGHSADQLIAAGIEVPNMPQTATTQANNPDGLVSTPNELGITSPTNDLSSTMATLIDAANRAAAARREATVSDIVESVASQTTGTSSPQNTQSLLGMSSEPSTISSGVITSSSIQPSPLDQIRALNSSLLPTTLGGNNSLATALGLFNLPNGTDGVNDVEMSTDSQNPQGPRRSSGGKPKSYKCKQCHHVSMSKEESWQHARTHIPPEKQLVCKQCDFVTEYKHHLEYHLRNHYGSKPFKCSKCAYACVNKSMLNSHMKSHSNAYQFQCLDCNYQSKYCHSLKMHLRKYNHRRKPGGAPMTDDQEDEMMMMDEATRQAIQAELNEFNLAPPGAPTLGANDISKPIATTLNSMLLQPIVTSSSLQYAFMRQQQQQVEQMNAIIRAANPLACNLCDFRTASNDELGRHIVEHIAANQEAAALQQPSLASILNNYQSLIQNMPSLLPGTPPQGLPAPQPRPPSTTASATATITVGPTINGSSMPQPFGLQNATLAQLQQDALLRLQQSQEIQNQEEGLKMDTQGTEMDDDHHRFSPDDASGHDESATHSSGERSSTSPGGSKGSRTSSSSGDIGGGSKKRKGKALKLEQISQRLQDKRSPDAVQRAETSATDDSGVATSTSSLVLPSVNLENVSHENLEQVVGEVRILQDRCREILRHTCAHCEISFKDMALYQIHLGYHSIEQPFKCNRCGYSANDSLGFNLHLLQERH